MFCCCIGFGSKAVITGDVTQIDLPAGRKSKRLDQTQQVVRGIEGVNLSNSPATRYGDTVLCN
ncbi:MAG: PhoH family protein [Blastocatellia bacterium]